MENDPRDVNPLLSRLAVYQNITMAQFAAELQRLAPGYLAFGVEDATGLAGAWDFMLSFSPAYLFSIGASGPSNPRATDPNGAVSLFDAINKLGLKLEMRKRMIPVVVIDHIEEKPSDN